MTGGIVLFAAAEVFDPLKKVTEGDGFNRRDALLVISIGVVLGVLLFVWAYFRYRKKEGVDERESETESATTPSNSSVTHSTSQDGEPERRRRRKRRRRRDHRPRNPSLQQTGGLPPPRPDDQLPKE